jgi:hypothetical protein
MEYLTYKEYLSHKDMKVLSDRLRDLLGVDYVGHVTSSQIRLGRETLRAIIEKLEES